MSRQDYELIADAIHEWIDGGRGINKLVEVLGLKLKAENPAFDMDKFETRCWWGPSGQPPIPKALRRKKKEVVGEN